MTEINGRSKWVVAIGGAAGLGLLAWNFAAVQTLQISFGAQDQRLSALRSDLEALRQVELSFQAEMRASLSTSQVETRVAISRVTDVLNDLRVRISETLPQKHDGKL